jgi:hypothetical protein
MIRRVINRIIMGLPWSWAFYKDENYSFRQPLCDRYVPANDISDAINHLVSQTNPAFHPNPEGAAVYTKASRRSSQFLQFRSGS